MGFLRGRVPRLPRAAGDAECAEARGGGQSAHQPLRQPGSRPKGRVAKKADGGESQKGSAWEKMRMDGSVRFFKCVGWFLVGVLLR